MSGQRSRDNGYSSVTIDSPEDSPQHDGEGTSSGKSKERQSDKKIQKLNEHVKEVTNVMTENINKILERGQRLDNLEDRSDLLTSRADEFRVSSRRVARKMWWQNARCNILIGLIVVSIIVIIIVTLTNKK